MLTQVAEGVLVHESEFIKSNSTVVLGEDGVLLVDPGITGTEMSDLATDLRALGQPVVAGFSTHPDWDHVLWHENFGNVPRYGTARGASYIHEVLAKENWRELVTEGLPPEYVDDIPIELFGRISALPADADHVPWNGPVAQILEHPAHAPGHAALLIRSSRVLIAGDMLSDILMPFIDLETLDPLGDYLAGLELFDHVADDVDVVIPGHGSVGTAEQVRARIDLDRAYVEALRAGRAPDDYRVGPSAPVEWLADVHEWQLQQLSEKRDRAKTS
jgi:glyoxylase-like metal-dependent hydrolase (beta-lactamase superfamily II)